MATIEQIYRENLRALIKESGTLAAFAESIGKSPAQVSQWVNASTDPKTNKPRVLSRQSAREIERKRGKPEGWMDADHSAGPSTPTQKGAIYHELTEDELEMLANFRQVTDKDRARVSAELASRAEELRDYLSKAVPQLPVLAGQSARRAAPIARAIAEVARNAPRQIAGRIQPEKNGPQDAEPELPFEQND